MGEGGGGRGKRERERGRMSWVDFVAKLICSLSTLP